MTPQEASEIIIKERDSLKANPRVKVEDCLYEAFDLAIKALEQEPCDDAVSRQAVEDAIAGEIVNGESLGYVVAWDILSDLPPVTPAEKVGHWYKKELPNGHWKCACSECDYGGRFEWVACPNCGVRMVWSQESEDKDADSN